MRIRNAKRRDLSQCAKLLQIPDFEFPEGGYPDEAYLQQYLGKDFFLVAEEDEEHIIGCIVGEKLRGYIALIWFLVVAEEKRGEGIGSKLLLEFEERCKRRGISWTTLYASTSSKIPLSFYEMAGYHRGSPLIEMTKHLSDVATTSKKINKSKGYEKS